MVSCILLSVDKTTFTNSRFEILRTDVGKFASNILRNAVAEWAEKYSEGEQRLFYMMAMKRQIKKQMYLSKLIRILSK